MHMIECLASNIKYLYLANHYIKIFCSNLLYMELCIKKGLALPSTLESMAKMRHAYICI